MENVKVFKNMNGEIVTDSLRVASDFANGRHDNVISKIKALEVSYDFRERHLKLVKYTNKQNKVLTKYELTKSGFMMLVMHYQGFTELKEQYITEYEDMEKFISESKLSEEFLYYRRTGKIARKELTDTINEVIHPSTKFVYSNYTNLVYKKLFGKDRKHLSEERGLSKKDNIRDFFTNDELGDVLKLEKRVESYIVTLKDLGFSEKEIYHKIKEMLGL